MVKTDSLRCFLNTPVLGIANMLNRDIVVLPVHSKSTENGMAHFIKGGSPMNANPAIPAKRLPIFLGYFEETDFQAGHYQSVLPFKDNKVLQMIVKYGGFDVARTLGLPLDEGEI